LSAADESGGEVVSGVTYFIAVPVSAAVQAGARQAQQRLRQGGWDWRWTRPERMHVTLVFLGAVEAAVLGRVQQILREEAAVTPGVALTFGALGVFGPARAPRVVWQQVEESEQSSGRLVDLHARLTARLREAGVAFDDRPLQLHLTLGRARRRARAGRVRTESLASIEIESRTDEPVQAVHLYASNPRHSSEPYEVVCTAALAEKHE
jgi:2'-5' RNA ligase